MTGSIDKESEDRIVAAVLRGVMASSLMNLDKNVNEVTTHAAAHGSRIGSAVSSVAGSTRSRGSSMTFNTNPHQPWP